MNYDYCPHMVFQMSLILVTLIQKSLLLTSRIDVDHKIEHATNSTVISFEFFSTM